MKKLNNKKGFTLAELLIVVAIIGVMTVIAVPIFTSQLEKSKESTDIANLREAKAAAATAYLAGDAKFTGTTEELTYKFDASKGMLVPGDSTVAAYGKGTATDGGCDSFVMSSTSTYIGTTPAAGCWIEVKIKKDGTISMAWKNS